MRQLAQSTDENISFEICFDWKTSSLVVRGIRGVLNGQELARFCAADVLIEHAQCTNSELRQHHIIDPGAILNMRMGEEKRKAKYNQRILDAFRRWSHVQIMTEDTI